MRFADTSSTVSDGARGPGGAAGAAGAGAGASRPARFRSLAPRRGGGFFAAAFFSFSLAGGGFRPGHSHGATDEFGFNAVEDRVSVHDLHATILHQLGIDHEHFTYRFQGRRYRLTDVFGEVVPGLLA